MMFSGRIESDSIQTAATTMLSKPELHDTAVHNDSFAILTLLLKRITQLQSDIQAFLALPLSDPQNRISGNLQNSLSKLMTTAEFVLSMKNEASAMKLRVREEVWAIKLAREFNLEVVPVAKDGNCLYTTAWLSIIGEVAMQQPGSSPASVLQTLKAFAKKEFMQGSKAMRRQMADYMRSHFAEFKQEISASLVEAITCASENRTTSALRVALGEMFPGFSTEMLIDQARLVPPEALEAYLSVMEMKRIFGERTEARAVSGAFHRPFHLYYMPFGWGCDIDKALEEAQLNRMPKVEDNSYGFSSLPPPSQSSPPVQSAAYDGEMVSITPTEIICANGVDENASPVRVLHTIAANHFELLWSMRV